MNSQEAIEFINHDILAPQVKDHVMKLLKKDIELKPIKFAEDSRYAFYCPNCHNLHTLKFNWCNYCGQHLDWSE